MIKPKQVIIEATSACNLKCRYCPGLNTKSQHMSLELFNSIVDRIDFDTVVIPWMNGEPLLHPHYIQMLMKIEEKGLPYYITTNGMVFNTEVFDYITRPESTCYQVIVSLDGSFKSSIETARPGSDIGRIFNSISYLRKACQNKDTDFALKICRRGQDWEEIEDYVNTWLNKIDFVIVGDSLIGEDNPTGFRHHPCQYFDNNFMVIRANGDVVRCAYNTEAANNPIHVMGTVDNDTPLLEVYNNRKFTDMREMQNHGEYEGPCDTCGFAYTGLGFSGEITMRNDPKKRKVYYHRDYYNQFFSLTKKWKDDNYYE